MADAEKAVKLDATGSDAWECLGLARRAGGNAAGGLEAYSRAIELDADNGSALVNRANSYDESGEFESDRGLWRRATDRSGRCLRAP